MKKKKPVKTQESYTQVYLEFVGDGSVKHDECRWIPSKYAVRGKKIRVKATGEIWRVLECYSTWDEDQVLDIEEARKKMIETTDYYRDSEGHWVPIGSKKKKR